MTGHIPPSWARTTLGEISGVTDRDHRTPIYIPEGIPLISPRNFTQNGIDFRSLKCVGVDELRLFQAKCRPEKGDILYSRIGTIGEARLVSFDHPFVALHSIAMVKPNLVATVSQFVLYVLMSPETRNRAKRNIKSVGTPDLGLDRIKKFPLCLPPLPEQKRIVAKIEELFSDLDAGVEALKKAKAEIKRYRQSVLTSAFEGKMTEEWRKGHKGKVEPASVLLERIKAERKKALGSKYREPPPLDTSELPELPGEWVWASFPQLAEADRNAMKAGPFGSALKKQFYVGEGYKVYGQEQVIRGDPSYGDYYIDAERYELLKSCAVKPGDILISLVGTVGRVLVLPERIKPGIINPRLIKLSLDQRAVFPKYVKAYLETSQVKQYTSIESHGGTMEILNMTILRQLPIPLPHPLEQEQMVSEIERRFSVADEAEKVIDRSLKQAETLRQSILKRAFEGRLVPQDPKDEPAERLLERIRQERLANSEKRIGKSKERLANSE
jgi:type I restriction enzyme S subunit